MESLTTSSTLVIADFGVNDNATAAALTAFNRRATALIDATKELVADLEAAPTILAIEAGKISERAAKLRNRRAAILLATRDAWRDRVAMLRDIECAIRGELEELAGVLAATEAAATKSLEELGIAAHLMPCWADAPETARHQFRHQHLFRVQSVSDCQHLIAQREGDIRAIADMIEASRAEAVRAAADLTAVIARELSIA